jgi:acid phosphatase (class A)
MPKTMFKHLLLLAVLFAIPLTSVYADDPTDAAPAARRADKSVITWNAAEDHVYLPAGALSPELLPAPPAEKTAEHKKQLQLVRAAQKKIRANELTAITDEARLNITHITSVIGINNAEHHPALFHLLERVLETGDSATGKAKKFWNTRRPFIVDKTVKLRGDRIESPSYPSGHTMESRLLAEVVGLLASDKRGALRARADEIAWHRVQAGVHYPNDLEGGKLLAMLVLGNLLSDADFQRDLSAAATELKMLQAKPTQK